MAVKLYTGTGAKEIDRLAITEHGYIGLDLMVHAGETAFQWIEQWVANEPSITEGEAVKVLILCGAGNNGGDGYVVGRCAVEAGWELDLLASKTPNTADAKSAAQQYKAAGGTIQQAASYSVQHSYHVIVDAMLGVGISGAPRGEIARLVDLANTQPGLKVAIDVPTGVDADTGAAYQPVFQADKTVSFIADKIGLHTGPAVSYCGEIVEDDLQVSRSIRDAVPHVAEVLAQPVLLQRSRDSHKGSYGSVVVAGGDNGMLGAALLAGGAALRTGSGKVYVMSTDEHLDLPALSRPELMSLIFEPGNLGLFRQANAIVLGPGLGLNAWGKQVFQGLISLDVPMLIDADGLTLLARSEVARPEVARSEVARSEVARSEVAAAETAQIENQNQWVLTPHPGEAATLLGISTREVQHDRLSAAQEIASRYRCVCVLKGAGTLIAGHGEVTKLCILGNPGMATAGMGDVLSGIIGSLMGQGYAPRKAAEAGVWLHSYSADSVVEQSAKAALIASDIIDRLAVSIHELEK